MDVAGFVFAALGFVEQAIKAGILLRQVASNYSTAGRAIHSIEVRLKAQKYTLELWHSIWIQKVNKVSSVVFMEEGADRELRTIWGEEGYRAIMECLGQVNVKLGEASRTLKTVDVDSLGLLPSPAAPSPVTPEKFVEGKATSVTQNHSLILSETLKSQSVPNLTADILTPSSSKKERWYHRVSRSISSTSQRPQSAFQTPKIGSKEAEDQARLAEKVLQQKLSPGTKFKWSLVLKDELRALLGEVDEWLTQLQTLSKRCEENQQISHQGAANPNPRIIRKAAKALYSALLDHIPNPESTCRVDFKLEKERTDSGYFDQSLGPIDYLDVGDRSLKFPLFVTSAKNGKGRVLLVAESIATSPTSRALETLETVSSLEKVEEHFANASETGNIGSILLPSSGVNHSIIIHGIRNPRLVQTSDSADTSLSSFSDLMASQPNVDPLLSGWMRLKIACTIAISVLHLHQTGWISDQLQTGHFYFIAAQEGFFPLASNDVGTFVTHPTHQAPTEDSSPFDCLRRPGRIGSLLIEQDQDLTKLFHQLGIVLFELGRGKHYQEFWGKGKGKEVSDASSTSEQQQNSWGLNKGVILEEVDKIPFGRPYRDLVKLCLAGSLYAISATDIDTQFNREVVEKLFQLEKHFRAIVSGE